MPLHHLDRVKIMVMQPGELCSVTATFIEDRSGRALVRLPNGSKSSVPYGALIGLNVRGHFVPSLDGTEVNVFCLDDDWSDLAPDFNQAAGLLQRHSETHSTSE